MTEPTITPAEHIAALQEARLATSERDEIRAELAEARKATCEALAALEEMRKAPPASSAPAAPVFAAPGLPPVDVPKTFREWVNLPSSVQEQMEKTYPALKATLEAEHAARLSGGRTLAPTHSGPDLNRAAEAAARLRATLARANAGQPSSYTTRNGRTTVPTAPFITAPAPGSARKTAPSSARRN
jgi:hypothetical protein